MSKRQTSLIILGLFALSVLGFWLLQKTTPERLASLTFFVLVGAYALYVHRFDVVAAATAFFAVLDINLYLFDQLLPIWLGLIMICGCVLVVWFILFGRYGWHLAVVSMILMTEVMLALQYINLQFTIQAFLSVIPFVIISQYLYFQQRNGEDVRELLPAD